VGRSSSMDSFDNLPVTSLTFQKNAFMTKRVKFRTTIWFLLFSPHWSYLSNTELHGFKPTTFFKSSLLISGVRTGISGKFCLSRGFRN